MYQDTKILVTGVAGTVGSELVKQLLAMVPQVREVVGLDNSEAGLFLLDEFYRENSRVNLYSCDLLNRHELRDMMNGVDYVFHAAAMKHVTLCERTPSQAVSTNIIGLQNVINAAADAGVKKVIFTSSDKAVNPTSVMGTSKLMGERLMTAANAKASSKTIFASTRFGNVLGSSGSVVPIFLNQINEGKPITITDPHMSRFVMTLAQSVELVLDSCRLAKGGEVFITKMPVLKIVDLARAMIQKYQRNYDSSYDEMPYKLIGSKPGEKLYEELMSDEETGRAIELKKYFVIKPAFRGFYKDIDYSYPNVVSDFVGNPYISKNEENMSIDEICRLLSFVLED